MSPLDRIRIDSLGLWPLRLLWLLLPLLTGPGFDAMLDGRSGSVRLVSQVGLWTGWFTGLVALLAPSTVGLTALRIVAPGVSGAALWGAVASGDWSPATISSVGVGLVVLVAVLLPQTGDAMVNGSSYGPERRLALRPPAALMLGPIQATWLVMFTTTVGAALSLASGNVVLGLPLALVAGAAVWLGVRSFHQLARRWIVFVPAGFVIHDYWSMAESLLIPRKDIASLGPVPLDKGELLDLSGGAQGLALLVETKEHTTIALRARRTVETFQAHRIVFTPTLPGKLLHEARVRGITIG